MASETDVDALRRATDTAPDDEQHPETLLISLLDSGLTINAAALVIWREKAAYYAKMVNVSEGGSSRSMSSLQQQALNMVAMYERAVAQETTVVTTPLAGRSFTVAIERP